MSPRLIWSIESNRLSTQQKKVGMLIHRKFASHGISPQSDHKMYVTVFIVQPKNSLPYYARWRKMHSFKVHNSHIWLPSAHAHEKWREWWNVIFDSSMLSTVAEILLMHGIHNLPYWVSLPKRPPRQIWIVRNRLSTQQKKLGSWSTSNARIQGIRIACFSFWAQEETAFIVQPPKILPCYVRWRKLPRTWLPHMAPLCTCSWKMEKGVTGLM